MSSSLNNPVVQTKPYTTTGYHVANPFTLPQAGFVTAEFKSSNYTLLWVENVTTGCRIMTALEEGNYRTILGNFGKAGDVIHADIERGSIPAMTFYPYVEEV